MDSSILASPYLWAALVGFFMGPAMAACIPRGQGGRASVSSGKPAALGRKPALARALAILYLSLSLSIGSFWAGFFLSGLPNLLNPGVLLCAAIVFILSSLGFRWKLGVGLPLVFLYSLCLLLSAWLFRDWTILPGNRLSRETEIMLTRISSVPAGEGQGEWRYEMKKGGRKTLLPPVVGDISPLIQRIQAGGAWPLLGIRNAYRVLGLLDGGSVPKLVASAQSDRIGRLLFEARPGAFFVSPSLVYSVNSLEPLALQAFEGRDIIISITGISWKKP